MRRTLPILMAISVLLSTRFALAASGDTTSMLPLAPRAGEAVATLVRDDAEARALFRDLLSQADRATSLRPDPLEVIVYQGHLDNHPDRIRSIKALRDMFHVRALATAHAVTGEEPYADKAREYVLAWAGAYRPTGDPINENKLSPLIAAYDQLRDHFPAEEQERVDSWLREIARLQAANPRNANWNSKRIKLMALAGHALRDEALLEAARAELKKHVEANLYADGTSSDLHERDALSYHNSGLTPLLETLILLADAADLYAYQAPSGGSVKKSVEYSIPFADGSSTRAEWVNSKAGIDRRRAEAGFDYYRPGKPFKPEQALELLDLASYFEPEYAHLASRIRNRPDARYSDWQHVVNAALRRAR